MVNFLFVELDKLIFYLIYVGSILVWIVEWLDECAPGSFRQPHVTFSLQIPNAIPAPDAASICSR